MKSLVRDKFVELQRALLHLSYDSPIRPPEDCNTSENVSMYGTDTLEAHLGGAPWRRTLEAH
jgi:hypothetical protein